MKGPDHYREAERLLSTAPNILGITQGEHAAIIAVAQVHATLALTAATVMPFVLNETYQDVEGVEDWARATAPHGRDVFADGDAEETR